MGERQHVAGTLDQRVLRMRHVVPDNVADRVVDGGRLRPLDDVDRRGQPGERVDCEQAVVEQDVPQVTPGLLGGEERLAARADRAGPYRSP